MGIQIGFFDIDDSQLGVFDIEMDQIDDLEPTDENRDCGQRRSARRAVESLLEKKRLRRQLTDFVL